MSAPPLRRLVALASLALGLLSAPSARADDRLIDQGVIYYQTGLYNDCIQLLQGILRPGSPSEPTGQESRSRARMHLAACLVISKREAEADAQFEQLIREDYRYEPSRASFPTSVMGRFLQTQFRLRDEIEAKTREDLAREAEIRRKKEEHERLEKLRQDTIEMMARQEISVQRNYRLVALLPFGVGQFQNRQPLLGWTLLGAQTALAATSVISYLLTQNIERQFSLSVDETEAVRRRDLAVQVNRISFGAFAALALGGVLHAQITFVPEFREVRERPLPPPVPILSAPTGGTLLWRGTF